MRAELLDPIALRTFVSVVEHGSFTGAAAAGGYTQSAVSRQMAALEGLCGVELFARVPRGVRLTPAGEYLLPHARSLLDRLTDTARALDAMRTLDAGSLRIGSFATANAALLPGALARFRTAYPKIALTLREGTTERLLPMVEAGDLDLAVVSTHKRASLDIAGAELLPVLDDPLLVALGRGHRLAQRRRVPLAELAEESWIVADTPEALAALNSTCAPAGFTPHTPLRVAEWQAKLSLVAEGLGVAIVPGIAAGRVPEEVVLRPVTPEPPRRSVCLAVPRHARRSPAVLAFHAELRASAEGLREAS
ncbi:DNA-binding transcriptional LysR family regulator [Crossiella equi]|uniref:DNA-binding transcriptional LysR family regulator n=1 Tax=Crossiella equi TaxID=130796 RepID=A0ABS5ABR2_9PSEU|nr:LysR substrate-binding domain-containing protein [Crossiella equi]MBP2473634.1 DNA-binding transcriptional LysR family regulator [Crossiella equi]